ncbi:HAD family hydrolase [Anditalea andensis]|uniref:Haloacid dehalogenase n=1 Tax=Anditalea andensis TaxID=1048983 RepID=A0A074LN05_9BACT|nr:HAD family phosphatase [Anditalea andensis]KEO75282.1 haloacid dehalogenase [Anditalea andensis]
MNQAVIFDMDGVICHTNPTHADAFRKFFTKYGIEADEADFKAHMYGKNNSYIMSHFFGREIMGSELQALEFEKESLFRDTYKPIMEAVKGYMDFLYALKAEGFKTAVATSAPLANLELISGGLQLGGLMDSFMSSEDVKAHKPDPEVYLKTAANLNVDAEQCVVFEDSYSGAMAGLNAGMKVVAVLTSHKREELPECHEYINDFTEISVQKIKALLEK